MKLLLDTCTFLWIIRGDSELSESARILFSQAENEVFLSAISNWEMLVKYQLGRLPLPDAPEQFITQQRKLHRIESLSLDEIAIAQLQKLPDYHKDPFDRMLICQAIAHGMTILTPDKDIQQYPVQSVW
jgi:PIN domain nuclease of toxin-antitoxin system